MFACTLRFLSAILMYGLPGAQRYRSQRAEPALPAGAGGHRLPRVALALVSALTLPAAVIAEPVTVEFRSHLLYIQNQEMFFDEPNAPGPVVVGLAYPSESLPFSVGDEMRAVFTYDLAQGAGGCFSAAQCDYRIIDGIISIGKARFSLDQRIDPAFIRVTAHPGANHIEFGGHFTPPIVGNPWWTGSGVSFPVTDACLASPDLPSPEQLAACTSTARQDRPLGAQMGLTQVEWAPNGNELQLSLHSGYYDSLAGTYVASPVAVAAVSDSATVGTNVTAAAVSGDTSVLFEFDQITTAGEVSVVTLGPSDPRVPPPPSAFDFAGMVYEISTTALFSGEVEICLPWSDPNVTPTMLHSTNGSWVPLVTTFAGGGVVCAATSSFSPFALVVEGAALQSANGLVRTITEMNRRKGILNSLDAKLSAAMKALADMRNDNDVAAAGSLNALLNEIVAQRGKQLTYAEADLLSERVRSTISYL